MKIGERIKEFRERKGLSQDKVGKLVGRTRERINQIEKEDDIRLSVLVRIANALDVDLPTILEGVDGITIGGNTERSDVENPTDTSPQAGLMGEVLASQRRMEALSEAQLRVLERLLEKDAKDESPKKPPGRRAA